MFTSHGFGVFAAVTLLALQRAITCGTLLLGGWRRRQHLLARAYGAESIVTDRLPIGLRRAPFVSGTLDVAGRGAERLGARWQQRRQPIWCNSNSQRKPISLCMPTDTRCGPC